MGRRSPIQEIEEFPPDIDRDRFGDWLSGFVDGEGCFAIGFHHRQVNPQVSFQIILRADDISILRRIQSYFGCGRVVMNKYYRDLNKKYGKNSKPTTGYKVNITDDLVNVIVPHFDRFPLRAKKSRDFAIWKMGLLLIHKVSHRPIRGRPLHHGGTLRRWRTSEFAAFNDYVNLLRNTREYNSNAVIGQSQHVDDSMTMAETSGEVVQLLPESDIQQTMLFD